MNDLLVSDAELLAEHGEQLPTRDLMACTPVLVVVFVGATGLALSGVICAPVPIPTLPTLPI